MYGLIESNNPLLYGRDLSEYYNWLVSFVVTGQFPDEICYNKLLNYLFRTEFWWIVPRDQNRCVDGIRMRERFVYHNPQYINDITGPCSILEMMVSLALYCDQNIMYNPQIGDRTAQWFWRMIQSLGMSHFVDSIYDQCVDEILVITSNFLNRNYEPTGKGGLFTINHSNIDMRRIEIAFQQNWYLNTLV